MAALVIPARVRAFFVPERGVVEAWPYAVIAALGIAAGSLLGISNPGQRVEWILYDLFIHRLAVASDPAPGIVVIAIDEPSFAEVGLPWPWPRSLYGTLVDRLVEGGAKTIAFDILFDVPGANPEDDAAFAESMSRAGNVVLAADLADIRDRSYDLTQWTDPTPELGKAAAATGAVRIPLDPDGVIRRATLEISGRPSLASVMAGREPGIVLPPDPAEPRLLRFNGEPRRGIVTVSFYQALDQQALPADFFRGKHVLVGRSLSATTIDQQADHFRTPVSAQTPGVEVHATILDATLRQRWIADPFASLSTVLLLAGTLGALAATVLYRLGPAAAPAASTMAIALIAGAGFMSLAGSLGAPLRIPVIPPIFAIAGAYALTAAYRFGLSTRERRMIKRAFQHYVSPAIVDQMLNDPSRLKLGGEEYEVTVLFSDLEGFTSLSEYLGAARLSAHLGVYFKEMLDEALAERGTLDKLIGDAIMVYFGCPIRDERHAVEACHAALAMQRRMIDLNARWQAEGLPVLRTRIGVNTGRAIAGNMGTDKIFNYTILGDCVNVASRLEGVNKEYGTLTIVGEDTWQRVKDDFESRELDWIRVKGKERPVAIFELVAEAGKLDAAQRELFGRFSDGLALYREGHWTQAEAAFQRALAVTPADGPSLVFAARCAHYLQHPPERWDGVHVMHTK